MPACTGERVVPGEVEPDLSNEHLARYAFAARRACGKRVLDAGCGSGYGSARLAAQARFVVGIDNALEAFDAASPQLRLVRGDCRALPFPAASFDLVVAFEVIEHIEDREKLLAEARRVLAAGGELILSTPNRQYYSESRAVPNPFHVHEFDYEELSAALGRHFPHYRIFLQNHAASVIFSAPDSSGIEAALDRATATPTTAHFFVALCSSHALEQHPAFVYVPESGNVLREREQHIALLEAELEQKNRWLEDAKESLANLHHEHQELEREAAEERLRAGEIIDGLEQENARKAEWGRQLEAELERLKEGFQKLRAEFEERTAWALQLEAERTELVANFERVQKEADQVRADLIACVDQLHRTEADLEESTRWAVSLDEQVRQLTGRIEQLTADLNLLFGSMAYRIGKRIGLAPVPKSDPRSRR